MKLQKQVTYKFKGKTCYKYVVVRPKDTIIELGWKSGEELNNSVQGKTLILKPRSES